jgi:predicted kinase
MEKTLILLRGISGSGKSTLAGLLSDKFKCSCFAADDYFMVNGNYVFDASKLNQAHKECFDKTEQALINEGTAIVHNTLTTEKEIKPYEELAKKHGAKLISLVVEKRHDGSNQHGLTDEKLKIQSERLKGSIKLI